MPEEKKYQIMDLVATGGTAVLYRAIQTSLDRVVAVKKLHHHLTTDENFTRRFILEAKAAASLDHENIVKIIDFGVEDGTYMMVMEFIEGESLKDVIDKWRRIPVDLALALTHQICMGLEHAHLKGIVHRDVKPGNIMLTRSGKVKITDFGLAKLAQSQTQHTAANSILGTPLYMSPEQAFGESVDQRSDLFSLGTVLYECLTGRQPFHGESYMGVIQNIIHQNAPHPSKLGVELPDGVAGIVGKAMNKNRDARFQHAREFRTSIEKHLGLDGLKTATESLKTLLSADGATVVLPQTARARRASRRLRTALSVAFTVAVVSGAAAATHFFSPGTMRGVVDAVVAAISSGHGDRSAPQENLSAADLSPGFDTGPLVEPVRPGVAPGEAVVDSSMRARLRPESAGSGDSVAPAFSRVKADSNTAARERPAISTTPSLDGPPNGGPAAPSSTEEGSPPDPAEPAPATAGSADAPAADPPAASGGKGAATSVEETVRMGWLSVTSEPVAEVYVDGRYRGDTPAVRLELPGGPHTLECRAPKHDPYIETLRITAGELSSRRLVLDRVVGRVSLSTIEGAEVHIDGVFAGLTPLDSPLELEAGRHQITIKKAGYHAWNNTVTVEAKQLLPLKITLSPIY